MYIRDLVLHTKNLEKQFQLYVVALGFPLVEKWESAFCIRAGITHLTFQESKRKKDAYHFAFGLKNDKVPIALKYLEEHVEVIQTRENPEKIVDFPAWNAKSVYFFDADGNVVECISRNCNESLQDSYSISDVKSVCEIGLPVENVYESYSYLNYRFNLAKCPGESDTFCPAGDENGMLILVTAQEKQWFPTAIPAQSVDFNAYIQSDCHRGEIVCRDGKLSIF